jgi:MFS family permease
LAASYAAIALGTSGAGWLADRTTHRRRLMLAVGLAAPPFVAATAAVTAFWQLILLTCIMWWLGGTALALATILGGLAAGPSERGRVLGLLAMMTPMGSVLGGLGIGALADNLGYVRLWTVLGILWLVSPVAALFVRDVETPPTVAAAPGESAGATWSLSFYLLLACGLLGAIGSFIGTLGRSLVMQNTFSAEALNSTVAVSGIVTLPFPLLMGALSDRLGRLRFIGLCYAAGIGGLVVYSVAQSLTDFQVASSLVAFISYVAPGVETALVVDVLNRTAVPRGLAAFSAIGWAGGIVGFATGGYTFQHLGYPNGFLLGSLIAGIGLLTLVPIGLILRSRGKEVIPTRRSTLEPRKE